MKYPYVVERILGHYPELEPEYVVKEVQGSSFVSLDKRYLYFQVSKAACTQMKDILRKVEGAPPLKFLTPKSLATSRVMFLHARRNVPVPSLVDLDNRTQREVLESPDFLRMTIVRNPYSRPISAWRNRVLLCEPGEQEVYLHVKGGLPSLYDKSIVTFREFIEYVETACDLRTCNSHWRRQADHIFFPALNFSHIGKIEQFGDALRWFEQHLGLSTPLVAGRKNSSLPVGSASYTQELADRVYRLYQRDFEIFGYDRGSWPASVGRGKEMTSVPVEKFLDEIIERNLVILGLHQEFDRLNAVHRCLSRLHLFPVVNGVVACRSAGRRVARKVKQRVGDLLGPAGRGKRNRVTPA